LCDGPSAHIKALVEADVCWRLVQLLMHRSWRVTKPALRTIGNMVCAEDETDYTQHILEAGAVPCLRQLVAHSNREIQKEACWTLSNIAAGTVEQIQTVLDSGAVPSLVALASAKATDPEVKNEACWVVLNATSCGSDHQIEYLVKQGCVGVLGELLGETSMVMMALEGLERILQVGDDQVRRKPGPGANPYAALLATSRIEALETHRSSAIAKRASRIWKQHFVTCAICSASYSKHSTQVQFCKECTCHVCGACDCAVFHLSYQEALWSELAETGDKAKETQARTQAKDNRGGGKKGQAGGGEAGKKSKKAKKKKKDKAGNKEASGAKETSVGKDEAAGATKEAEEKGAAVEKQKQEEATEKHQVSKVLSSVEVPDALADVRPPEPGSPEGVARRKRGATGRKADRREEAPGVEEKGAGKVKGVANGEAKEKGVGMASSDSSFAVGSAGSGLASGLASGKDKDSSGDLVSYLQATGSILALAEMLDEEEDDCGVSDEDMRLLQEAALKRREDSKPSQAASSAAKGNLPKGNGSKGNGSKGGNSKGNPRGQKK